MRLTVRVKPKSKQPSVGLQRARTAGTEHNIVNTSSNAPMKLYTVYAPPEHKDGTIHQTKAGATEEHFDGVTTDAA